MAKRLAYYHPSGKEPWPLELSHKLSKFGIASFDADSEGDQDFRSELIDQGVTFERHEVVRYSKKELLEHPFHYLTTACDRDYDLNGPVLGGKGP